MRRATRPDIPYSEEYVIPPDEKARVLEALYPFKEVPGLGELWFDTVKRKEFAIRDFKVVREDEMNILTSPYYYEGGATALDWAPMKDAKFYSDEALDELERMPEDDEEEMDELDDGDEDGPLREGPTMPTVTADGCPRYFGLVNYVVERPYPSK